MNRTVMAERSYHKTTFGSIVVGSGQFFFVAIDAVENDTSFYHRSPLTDAYSEIDDRQDGSENPHCEPFQLKRLRRPIDQKKSNRTAKHHRRHVGERGRDIQGQENP